MCYATTITFDFNSLSNGASDSSVQTYMRNQISGSIPGGSVTVTGAVASNSYTGDGHVVGPCVGSNCTSTTLATTGGTFIMNNGPTYNEIKMVFSGLSIYQVSFNLEIFPDASCANGNTCGQSNYPDFIFKANGTTQQTWYGSMPAAPGYTHSPYSGSSSTELAPQLLITTPVTFNLNGATTLEFIDWPAEIGIDCLKITTTPVPEPGSLLLLGGGMLASLPWLRRKLNR